MAKQKEPTKIGLLAEACGTICDDLFIAWVEQTMADAKACGFEANDNPKAINALGKTVPIVWLYKFQQRFM